jgi:hypothetical protein
MHLIILKLLIKIQWIKFLLILVTIHAFIPQSLRDRVYKCLHYSNTRLRHSYTYKDFGIKLRDHRVFALA